MPLAATRAPEIPRIQFTPHNPFPFMLQETLSGLSVYIANINSAGQVVIRSLGAGDFDGYGINIVGLLNLQCLSDLCRKFFG